MQLGGQDMCLGKIFDIFESLLGAKLLGFAQI